MKKRFCRRCLLMLCVGLLFGGCKSKEKEGKKQELSVTFFNVGKGDAILVTAGEETMLIDAGYEDTAEQLLGDLKYLGITSLDYLVMTHFDKDHVGGADRVLEALKVKKILQPNYVSDGSQYLEYRETLSRLGLEPETVTKTKSLHLGEARLLFFPPQKGEYEEEDNDWSLVVSLSYGEERFLFTGDSERERLDELLAQTDFELSHNVLKVPHHGIREKNSEEFFQAVAPELAVITCSEEEPPEARTRKLLKKQGAEVYLTSEGTVTCTTDGHTLRVKQ